MSEPFGPEKKDRRFQPVPARYLFPNLITLLALCSGITAIRFAIEARYELAVAAIILAVVLDAMDGRLARLLKGTSRFGAELDSLADFVNFGVAPAMILYLWSLNSAHTLGWVIALMYAIACALRLARFNVALDDPDKPLWANAYFTGIPAPAGALLALLPLYFGFLDMMHNGHDYSSVIAVFTFIVAMLMVSRVPTFSGKTFTRIPRNWFLPVLVGLVMFGVFLVSFPWESLAFSACLYLVLIPVSVMSYRRRLRQPAG